MTMSLPNVMPINTYFQYIAFNSDGPLVNLHSAKLTFPNVSHSTERVKVIYCQDPKICYLMKYGFFFMAWFELHIRNCGAAQWLFTIWGRGKAVQRPSGAIFHSPIKCSHRWLKSLQPAATAGPAGHIWEKEMDFSERRNVRTCRHKDFPCEFIWEDNSRTFPLFFQSSILYGKYRIL